MRQSVNDVRRAFLDFFKAKAHAFVPSSPVVPHDDPTLLFTNAGMNQFKPIFLGQAAAGSDLGKLKRAVNSQKCIRAGGKHNDLDDVGKDTYHHTFFEMLGNWSFGDYFKAEAIAWAWELLTKVYGIPPERLYVTYFEGNDTHRLAADEETRELWLKYLPASHVLTGNMKDNFWEMGDTGPCGPCTEIHFDRVGGRNAAKLVNTGDPDVLEIWNNVFIQYNREADGSLKPLPANHVDTGMGLERLVSVLQGKRSNYDTDVFAPLFEAIERHTGARPYRGKLGAEDIGNVDTAYRVIADHIRTLTFAITDGAVPSNVGRGYVLRRILRRAVRYGRQMLGAKSGFFAQLVPVIIESMGEAFPELYVQPQKVQAIILDEEESFGRTLDRGIDLFERAVVSALKQAPLKEPFASAEYEINFLKIAGENAVQIHKPGPVVDGFVHKIRSLTPVLVANYFQKTPEIQGSEAFKLSDTFGFPIDLTALMAEERGLKVDMPGYEAERKRAEELSRSKPAVQDETTGPTLELTGDETARLARLNIEPTDDSAKFANRDVSAHIKAIWNGNNFDEAAKASIYQGRRIGVILNRTNLYSEMGGQVSDHGRIQVLGEAKSSTRDRNEGGEFRVEEVRSFAGYVLHIGHILHGELRTGDTVQVHQDKMRRAAVASNHTATHLLNFNLRKVLGGSPDQKGSLVADDRLRFDFSHGHPVLGPELERIEAGVREQIKNNLTVHAETAPLYLAKSVTGARAVFGETYPDPVRVVSIGQPVPNLIDSPTKPEWNELSVEFCGGTHVATTKEIHNFTLIAEEAVAKGVRRVVGLTGKLADAAISAGDEISQRVKAAEKLEVDALTKEVAAINGELEKAVMPLWQKHAARAAIVNLQEKIKVASKQASAGKRDQAIKLARQLAESAKSSLENFVISTIDAAQDRQALQTAVQLIRDTCPRSAVMLFDVAEAEGKVTIMAAVPEAFITRGLKAGDWVREAAAVVGGKGGGKPDSAQGGGTDPSKVRESIAAARAYAHRMT